MVFDLRQVTDHEAVVIRNQEVTQVSSSKSLGVHMDSLCDKLQQIRS